MQWYWPLVASPTRYGSTGDGYRMLADLGHHISPLLPGLVPLYCDDWWLDGLEGVSLEGVALEARTGGHTIGRVAGEIMITPRGVGGRLHSR